MYHTRVMHQMQHYVVLCYFARKSFLLLPLRKVLDTKVAVQRPNTIKLSYTDKVSYLTLLKNSRRLLLEIINIYFELIVLTHCRLILDTSCIWNATMGWNGLKLTLAINRTIELTWPKSRLGSKCYFQH